jgi:hypothetical protein
MLNIKSGKTCKFNFVEKNDASEEYKNDANEEYKSNEKMTQMNVIVQQMAERV